MKDLTRGNLLNHLIHLAMPTVGGMLAFSLFNITDTYFVGKLGTDALAAMGFTFPVVMVAGAVSTGISTGAASVISRAYGHNDRHAMRRTATDGILLSLLVVALFSTIGLLTMKPLFTLLGASPTILPMIESYMGIWYSFVIVVMMPPVGDAAMRAVGDTYRPFLVMMICALLNIILDPILIFGWFGLPALGIQGAAIATVFSRFVGMIATLGFNHFYHRLIDWHLPKKAAILLSWKKIMAVGIPSVGISLLPQLIRMTLTILAAYTGGTLTVAAVAVGSRIEGFALIIAMAVGSSIVPLVGQNYGAGAFDRVSTIQRLLTKSAVLVGLSTFLIFLVFAKPVIQLFSTDGQVVLLSQQYLSILTLGSVGLNLYNFNTQAFNAMGLSKKAFMINGLGTCCLILPLMVIGSKHSFIGMLSGLALGQLILGIISDKISKRISYQLKTSSLHSQPKSF